MESLKVFCKTTVIVLLFILAIVSCDSDGEVKTDESYKREIKQQEVIDLLEKYGLEGFIDDDVDSLTINFESIEDLRKHLEKSKNYNDSIQKIIDSLKSKKIFRQKQDTNELSINIPQARVASSNCLLTNYNRSKPIYFPSTAAQYQLIKDLKADLKAQVKYCCNSKEILSLTNIKVLVHGQGTNFVDYSQVDEGISNTPSKGSWTYYAILAVEYQIVAYGVKAYDRNNSIFSGTVSLAYDSSLPCEEEKEEDDKDGGKDNSPGNDYDNDNDDGGSEIDYPSFPGGSPPSGGDKDEDEDDYPSDPCEYWDCDEDEDEDEGDEWLSDRSSFDEGRS